MTARMAMHTEEGMQHLVPDTSAVELCLTSEHNAILRAAPVSDCLLSTDVQHGDIRHFVPRDLCRWTGETRTRSVIDHQRA
jgi:hypothetical protein